MSWYQRLKGWRTVLFNVLVMLALIIPEIIVYLTQDTSWAVVLPSPWSIWAVLLVNIVNIALRAITDTKVGQRNVDLAG